MDLDLDSGTYLLNVTVGTPIQLLSMTLDINATRHTLNFTDGNTSSCPESGGADLCALYGAYAPDASSAFACGGVFNGQAEGEEFEAETNFSDLIAFGPLNTLAASGNDSSILATFVDDEVIDTRTLSLWNNPAVDQESEVLFGGVNTAQYRGTLHTYTMNEDGVPRLPVTSLQVISDEEETRNISLPETQFTISTLYYTVLPKNIASQFYEAYNITDRVLPCSRQNENRTVALTIGDTTIETPWEYLFYQIADSDRAIIGVEFLRNIYLAIDYDTGKFGFAELNTAPGEDDIRSLEDAEGVQGSGGDAGSGSGSGNEDDDTDTGAAGRIGVPGFGTIAVLGGISFASL
ncbi:aspartic peptidase domain-containing protein [Aspergillus filifer]